MIDIFMIDPPWPKKKGGRRAVRPNQGRRLDYQTMPVPAIFDLLDAEIFPQAAPTHGVFMWMIDEFLIPGEEAMYVRGYKRHARIVWDKSNGVAPCFTVRYSHEYLVWFYKPRLMKIASDQRGKQTTVLRATAREHSRKPDEAYSMLDKWYPTARKLDVFSRERRPGWGQWGDQPDFFQEDAT